MANRPYTDLFNPFFKNLGEAARRENKRKRQQELWNKLAGIESGVDEKIAYEKKQATDKIMKQGGFSDAQYNSLISRRDELQDKMMSVGAAGMTEQELDELSELKDLKLGSKVGERDVFTNIKGVFGLDTKEDPYDKVGKLQSLKSLVGLGEMPDESKADLTSADYFKKMQEFQELKDTGIMSSEQAALEQAALDKYSPEYRQEMIDKKTITALGEISPDAALKYAGFSPDKAGVDRTARGVALRKYYSASEKYKDISSQLLNENLPEANKVELNKQLSVARNEMNNAAADAASAGVPTAFLGQKADIDKETKERGKLKQGVVDLIDKRLDRFSQNRAETIKKLSALRAAGEIISNLPNEDTPAALFAAVKGLSSVIEPGMAVTEGEVRGYMGHTA